MYYIVSHVSLNRSPSHLNALCVRMLWVMWRNSLQIMLRGQVLFII